MKILAVQGELRSAPYVLLAACIGLAVPFMVPHLFRPDAGQSSFWRPVEVIATIKQDTLQLLAFRFHSKSYGIAFEVANLASFRAGALSVRRPDERVSDSR